jgi:adenine-specific DNA glycosylase
MDFSTILIHWYHQNKRDLPGEQQKILTTFGYQKLFYNKPV